MNKWRELLGQLEVLKTYYARLTERERYIVLGAGAGVIFFILISIYSLLLAATSSMGNNIEQARKDLRELSEQKILYMKIERQIQELEQTIRRTDPTFQLATELEKLARKHNVNMDSLKEMPGPPNELYQENQVAITLRQVTLKTLTNFLFDIENSRQLMRITKLQVKPNFQDPSQLNVNFVVSTFQPTS